MTKSLRSSVIWFVFAVVYIFGVSQLGASEVRLPYSNESGYETTISITNPTDDPVAVPDFWTPFGYGGGTVVVEAKSTFRFGGWPRSGGGVASFDLPDSLDAYAEIRDPNGVIVRIADMGAPSGEEELPRAFYDLLNDTEFRTFVFLYSPDGSAVTIRGYGESAEESRELFLSAGEVAISPLGDGITRAEVSVGWRVGGSYPVGHVYAFALISHQPGGELLVVRGR